MDLQATACSRLRVKRENFQTRMTAKGPSAGYPPQSSGGTGGGQQRAHSRPRPRTRGRRRSRASRRNRGAPAVGRRRTGPRPGGRWRPARTEPPIGRQAVASWACLPRLSHLARQPSAGGRSPGARASARSPLASAPGPSANRAPWRGLDGRGWAIGAARQPAGRGRVLLVRAALPVSLTPRPALGHGL